MVNSKEQKKKQKQIKQKHTHTHPSYKRTKAISFDRTQQNRIYIENNRIENTEDND